MYPLITIDNISIPSFGVMLVLGCIVTLLILGRIARTMGYPFRTLHTATLWMIVGGALGARLVYMVFVQHVFNPAATQNIGEGTMCYGFLLGAAVSVSLYLRFSGVRWDTIDACMPAWGALHICGRIGCFLAGCCFGTQTDLPWGVCYTHPHSVAPHGVHLHPTQLYEAGAVMIVNALLFRMLRRKKFSGSVVLAYFFFYAIVRFALEFLRADYRGGAFGGALSTSQVFALASLVVLGFIYLKQQFNTTTNQFKLWRISS